MVKHIRQLRRIDPILMGYWIYLRFLAVICLGMGTCYWIRLVGIFPGELWRIDHMPWQWQVLTGIFCVLYPIASLGLWMLSPWGIVLWIVAAMTETLAFTFYHSYFGYMPLIALLHCLLILLFILFQVVMFLKKRHKAVVITEY